MDTLTIGYGHRSAVGPFGQTSRTARTFVDFVISGQSLHQLFDTALFDKIGALGWLNSKRYENEMIDEYLGFREPALATGRTSFLVCPECGHIGCEAITARIDLTWHRVTWSDFGYETDCSGPELDTYRHIGPFQFDRTEYTRVFNSLRYRQYS